MLGFGRQTDFVSPGQCLRATHGLRGFQKCESGAIFEESVEKRSLSGGRTSARLWGLTLSGKTP